jgi:predicted amino acid racemase
VVNTGEGYYSKKGIKPVGQRTRATSAFTYFQQIKTYTLVMAVD